MFLPEGASCVVSVPPPAPLPMMMTSKRLSMTRLPLETGAAVHDAAIREDGGCGEIFCAISGEERDHGGNLLRARHAPQRYRRIQAGKLGRVVHRLEVDRRRHRTRADPDDEDVVFS